MSLLTQKADNAVRGAEQLLVAAKQLEILILNAERKDVREGFQGVSKRADELLNSMYAFMHRVREVRSEAISESFRKPYAGEQQ